MKVMGHGSEKTEQARAAAGDAQDYATGKAKDAHKYAKDSAEYAQAKANEAAEQGGSTWQKVKDGASQAYDTVRPPRLCLMKEPMPSTGTADTLVCHAADFSCNAAEAA